MQVLKTNRSFEKLEAPETGYGPLRIQQSSAIGGYDHSMDKPGSSFLWVGDAHLNKEQVEELIEHLSQWVKTGSLKLNQKKDAK